MYNAHFLILAILRTN